MLHPFQIIAALDGVASQIDIYKQKTQQTAEAGAVAELTASMAVITSAISLGGWIYITVESKRHKVIL